MNDLISRQAAIDKLKREEKIFYSPTGLRYLIGAIRDLPSAQPEQPSEIQDILDYLDTALHPIISPEHWSVYSELHDMISTLPTANVRENVRGEWIFPYEDKKYKRCSACGKTFYSIPATSNYCPNCGVDMRPISALSENVEIVSNLKRGES